MSGRIRSIKPEWLEDEALLRSSSDARVVSVALLLLADDYGNGRGSEMYLGAQIFPGEPLSKIREALMRLSQIRYVGFYEADGQRYFMIRNWKKHQKVQHAGNPRVPPPLGGFPETLTKIPETLMPDPDPDPDPDLDHDLDHDHDHDPIPDERKKKSLAKPKRTKTPSAPPADADGYTELVALWFENYERFYKTKPAWGAVYGRQLKAIMAKSTVEEMRRLIPAFFAWRRPEVIKAGHSLSTGFASLAMKLDELRADLAHPERRAFAAAINGDEKQATHEAEGAAQQRRVLAKLTEKQHAIGSGESSGNLGADADTVRGIQPASVRLASGRMGGVPVATVRAGTSLGTEAGVSSADDAWFGGHPGDDDRSEET